MACRLGHKSTFEEIYKIENAQNNSIYTTVDYETQCREVDLERRQMRKISNFTNGRAKNNNLQIKLRPRETVTAPSTTPVSC